MAVLQLSYVRCMIVQHCDGRANGPMQKRYVLFAVQHCDGRANGPMQKRYVLFAVQNCDGRANVPMQKRYVLFAVQDYTLGDSIQAQYRGHQLVPAQTYFNTIMYDWSSSCHPVGLWPGEEHYSVFATTRRISRCFFPLSADTVISMF